MLVKLAFEPQWEAKFEHNSYGFRPGYSTADAKRAVTRQLQGKPKYFLDADIKGCFDNIEHKALLDKLETFPMFENQIHSWLKAGILEQDNITGKTTELAENDRGTPQGGVISPLLANIALHGMEDKLISQFPRNAIKIIRYADDFVITGSNLNNVLRAKEIVIEFLGTIGLELSESKTRVGHTLFRHNGEKVGFDFLGFHFRNIACSTHRGVKNTRGKKQPFIQTSMPSFVSIQEHKMMMKALLKKLKAAPLEAVVKELSQRIRG
jgi:RNA-directed DNA polymerase